MRIKRTILERGLLVIAAIIGGGLGYAQDDLTQSLAAALTPPRYTILLALGVIIWLGNLLWHTAALKRPSLRAGNVQSTKTRLAFLLTFWIAASLGGISFFLINGMDYMTLWGVVLYSTLNAALYNGMLVALPLLIRDVTLAAAGWSGWARMRQSRA